MREYMKQTVIFIFLLLIAAHLHSQELRVAVVDFRGDGIDQATAGRISELIRNDMVKSGKYRVIERSQIDKILNEQGFQQTGCTDTGCAVEIGKLLSANKMLVGTVMKVGQRIVITGRMVDVQSGSADYSASVEAGSENDLITAAGKFSRDLAADMAKKSGKTSTIFGETISLKINATYLFMDFASFSPTYFSGGDGKKYGWNFFTFTYGSRLLQVGTSIIRSDGLHKTMFPIIALVPLYLMPSNVKETKGHQTSDLVGVYLMGEWAYRNRSYKKFDMEPYVSGRIYWDIWVPFAVFAGVTRETSRDSETRYFGGASVKLGIGQYDSKPLL